MKILLRFAFAIVFNFVEGNGRTIESKTGTLSNAHLNWNSSRKNILLPGVELPDFRNRKVVSDHGRIEDGTDSLTRLTPASNFAMATRIGYLMLTFFLPIILSFFALISTWFREKIWYPLLVKCIASSGAAFIKWGQWSSTRPDMFPETLCRCLSQLHSNAPVHSESHTRKLVQGLFGVSDISHVFDHFDMTPIASGSIAQVHKAVLYGTTVAVKIRHPRVAEKMAMDFRIMNWLAQTIDVFPTLRWINLKPSMEQFGNTMGAQTRLDIEAVHLCLFNENFKGISDVSFPQVICCSEDVLVETFEHGESISNYLSQYSLKKTDKKNLNYQMDAELAHFVVSRGEDLYLKMLLQDNLMHADLHPGNIMLCTAVQDDSNQQTVPRLILVDAGMVARLDSNESKAFIGLLQSLGSGDPIGATRAILQFSSSQQCTGEDAVAFEKDMVDLFRVSCKGYHTDVCIGEVLRGVLTLIRRHHVRMDVNYATLIMNVLCLDGMAMTLLPTYNLLDGAQPLLESHRIFKNVAFVGDILLRICLPIAKRAKRRQDRLMEKFRLKVGS